MRNKKINNNIIRALIFVFSIIFMPIDICKGENNSMIEGKVYYTVSNKLIEVDLAIKKQKEIYRGPDLQILGGLDKVDNGLFIIDRKGIEFYNIKDNTFRFIANGNWPLYIQEINSLSYYKYSYHGSKAGLYQKNLNSSNDEEFITDKIHGGLAKISNSEIAYYNKDKKIEKYDFINKAFRILDLTGYDPWAFYPKKNSLICKNEEDGNFYFVNVSTLEKEKIEISNPRLIKWCIIPADDQNCLIYSKIRVVLMAEYEDMYIYSVDEKKERKYLKDTYIHYGIYTKN